MNEIKNKLFLIFTLIFLSFCNGCNNSSKDGSDKPGERNDSTPTAGTDTPIQPPVTPPVTGNHPDRFPRCHPNPQRGNLQVALRAQETDLWCWAACAEMVIDNLRVNISQCDEANKQFGTRTLNCCNSPTPGDCNKVGWPEFDKYGFANDRTTDEALTWEEVTKQIDCGKTPFCITWHWDGGGGHMMVLGGYKIENGDSLVKILDPWPPGSLQWMSYSDYVSGWDHTHWDDFYNVRKKDH